MKTHLAILSILLLSLNAKAFESYEEAPEFLQDIPAEEALIEANDPGNYDTANDLEPYPALRANTLKKIQGTGKWAFKFVFIPKNGSPTLLSEYQAGALMKPASTLKLFTGWMGFNKNAKSEAFLKHMLKTSNNGQANATLQSVGGAQRMVTYYQKLDLPLNAFNFRAVDGCGLSHSNRVTVDLEINLLEMIRQSQNYDQFKELLAEPGSTGTLIHRLGNLKYPLYGKTGTLSDTVALAGFVDLSNGTLIFSMISNQIRVARPTARAIIDGVVADHINFVEGLNPPSPTQAMIRQFAPIDNLQ